MRLLWAHQSRDLPIGRVVSFRCLARPHARAARPAEAFFAYLHRRLETMKTILCAAAALSGWAKGPLIFR